MTRLTPQKRNSAQDGLLKKSRFRTPCTKARLPRFARNDDGKQVPVRGRNPRLLCSPAFSTAPKTGNFIARDAAWCSYGIVRRLGFGITGNVNLCQYLRSTTISGVPRVSRPALLEFLSTPRKLYLREFEPLL